MQTKHGVNPHDANEALSDPDRVVLDPDPSSRSGRTVRTIGYSITSQMVLTVITMDVGRMTHGVNGWQSNSTDRRRYKRGLV